MTKRVPLRYILRPREETNRPELDVLSVYRDHGVVPKDSREDNFNKTPQDLSRYQVVREGDLVVNKMKAWQGSLAISRHAGIVSPDYLVCSVSPAAHRGYTHYLLRSAPMISEYHRRAKGIRPAQWRLYWDDLASIAVGLPSFGQQQRIANYLDAETPRIDAVVERRTRLIQLMREREKAEIARAFGGDFRVSASGIPESVGNVPMVRLGALAKLQSGLTLDEGRLLDESAVKLPYLRVANVQDGRIDLSDVKSVRVPPEIAKRTRLQAGDVVITEGGDPDKLGRGAVWSGEIFQCLHQNHVFAIRPGNLLLPEYLALITRTSYARAYFEATASKTTGIASTSSRKILAFRIPLISVDEQRATIETIRARLSWIEDAIQRMEMQISLIREHRQALITAAVTGQFDVADNGR